MVYVAVFFVWVNGNPPTGLQSLQAFKTHGECVAYVRPLLALVSGSPGVAVKAYCPTEAAAFLGTYGDPTQ